MLPVRRNIITSFALFSVATSIDNVVNGNQITKSSPTNIKPQHFQVSKDLSLDGIFDEYSVGNETTVSPAPSISPSQSPSPKPTPAPSNKTVTPTTPPPTNAPPPTHNHPRHDWWKNLWKFLLKTLCWMFVAVLFFFAFGAIMSNRYRIYYYLRGSWYSFLQKLKWSRRSGRNGSAPSSTLNDIIFSDNDLQEGLLMRET